MISYFVNPKLKKMSKQKFYVVWRGAAPGIYATWDACKAQVSGFEGAQYKSFATRTEAEKAFADNPWKYFDTKNTKKTPKTVVVSDEIVKESLAVDAACSGNPGRMEYRGVWVADNLEIFRIGPMEQGTNNIGEFLAIVHALALLNRANKNYPVYSDSVNAIKWVAKKKCNTKLKRTPQNEPIFDLIARAEKWLHENTYTNPILKWETQQWGEIPADFGRK